MVYFLQLLRLLNEPNAKYSEYQTNSVLFIVICFSRNDNLLSLAHLSQTQLNLGDFVFLKSLLNCFKNSLVICLNQFLKIKESTPDLVSVPLNQETPEISDFNCLNKFLKIKEGTPDLVSVPLNTMVIF